MSTEPARDEGAEKPASDWRRQRRVGMLAIAGSTIVAAALWLAIRYLWPPITGMELVGDRMLFALKCCCVAILFSLVLGIEAVAHERLQTAAFDPLAGHEPRRLRVNQRFLQNTLEQFVVFAVGLFGLAAYSNEPGEMRAVLATTIVWILARLSFWIGYHRSAALRGIGAPGVMVSMLVLLYVVFRISNDVAGYAGAAVVLGAFLAIEVVLFRTTRSGSH